MNQLLKPIKLNQTGFPVSLLHKLLALFKLPVLATEVSAAKAGKDTQQKLQTLLKQLNFRSDDDSVLLNEVAIKVIVKAMTDNGLLNAEGEFEVSGEVRLSTGLNKKLQRLIAFDLDLKAVSIYRDLESLKEAQKKGGFEFLGEVISDTQGRYKIQFYDWFYKRAERKLADIVVFSIDNKDKIIGRSRLVNTGDYTDKRFVRDLEVVIVSEDERTEYQVLMALLEPFLEQSEISLTEIAKSSEQLDFTANELDISRSNLELAARAATLNLDNPKLKHELLYGIARQDINLDWLVLYRKHQEELRNAIATSANEKIIGEVTEREIKQFITIIQQSAITHLLDSKDEDGNKKFSELLSIALPKKQQRKAFLKSVNEFKGDDFKMFWETHLPKQPEFNGQDKLISAIQLTQELTLLSDGHQPLVKLLQAKDEVQTAESLVDFSDDDWVAVIKEAGVPEFVEGKDEAEKQQVYAQHLRNRINANFPTQSIGKMVKENRLGIENKPVADSVSKLFSNAKFDIRKHRLHDLQQEIEVIANEEKADPETVKLEAMKLQRLFQVSTSPEVMQVLCDNKLDSAYSIANIPRANFSRLYGKALGGQRTAISVHQRAEQIAKRAESIVMDTRHFDAAVATPAKAMSKAASAKADEILQDTVPNFRNLFGSQDLCECEHCRSISSPAAYFVELLQFLNKSEFYLDDIESPANKRSIYDFLVVRKEINANGDETVISGRRPDLAELELSCENTNTLIPYIDLANEIMEFYVAKESLENFKEENIGDVTADELRANPQRTNSQDTVTEAYQKLANAKFPFSLPFHKPLGEIRTYSDFLNTSRYQVMQALNPQPNPINIHRAITTESLELSTEGYDILVDNTTDDDALGEYFGLDSVTGELEDLIEVRKFMAQSGTTYEQLIELLKTRFINPHQHTIDYLENHFSQSEIDVVVIYNWLKQVHNGDNPDDAEIVAALAESGDSISIDNLKSWAANNFINFQQVITLFEPTSACNLDNTKLKTIKSIYEKLATSKIASASWSKIHRFIRLWRKTNWSIHQTDLILSALGEDDIRPETLSMIESVLLLQKDSKLPVNRLVVLWGDIDTYGNKSLYKKLFLNKTVQQIDEVFVANVQGNYLQDAEVKLVDHQSAILAAFRLTETELETLFPKEQLDFESILNISNLSAIYRYIVLAKALRISVTDLCKLIDLFGKTPFNPSNSPNDTYEFFLLAASTKTAKFKPEVLDYIFTGNLAADSKLDLDTNKTLLIAKTIRDGLDVIEQNHQVISEPALSLEMPEKLEQLEALAATLSLTPDILVAKLSLTFQSEIVNRLMEVLNSRAVFDVITKKNLGIATTVKDNNELGKKFSYIEASGRFSCIGVMSDDERTQLIALTDDGEFEISVGYLYTAPETFLNNNFDGVLSSAAVAEAIAEGNDVDAARADAQATTMSILLQRQTLPPLISIDIKLAYVYNKFLPVLKRQLQQNLVTTHVADLVGLSEEVTTLLISEDFDNLLSKLSTKGFSASYFNNEPGEIIDWNVESNPPSLERVDDSVNFSWEGGSPNPDDITANNFSARWKAYITPPTSGEYTLIVEVAESDELFNLYLDDQLILDKAANDEKISYEILVMLDAAKFHLLILEYAEESGDAGVKLSWKTATSAPEIIQATVAYPAKILNDFVQQASVFHRAATFIQGFKISGTELKHFIAFNGDFGDINFKKLKPEHWRRLRDYRALTESVPQSQTQLIELFEYSNRLNRVPETEKAVKEAYVKLVEKTHQSTNWQKIDINVLIRHFMPLAFDNTAELEVIDLELIFNGFKNEIVLNQIRNVITIVVKNGLSAQSIIGWGRVDTDFDQLQTTAQALKNTVKAKYEDKEWLPVASGLSDKLREQQNQALVSYLLVEPSIQEANITDADGLYEHFLIDVQMGACMNTSRIVQANAAIQLFVNRILLNLDAGIPPDAIDVERWDWMKNYRVWEANRKVFLYPQNWLEPEWRNDRSEFFKDLESHLLQNDITERSVEQGLRNYLMSMNEVANLDICGMHQESYDDGKLKFLHVFGRTHNLPYKYFYRRWNEFHKWSAWEKVQLDIRGVEGGENSGVHLIPVVWKGSLYLFWPEFMEMSKDREATKNASYRGREDASPGDFSPIKYWEIRLAWSEYVDGTWSSKQVSKENVTSSRPAVNVRIHPYIDHQENSLIFLVANSKYYGQYFYMSDLHSQVRASKEACEYRVPKLPYQNKYTKLFAPNKPLQSPSSTVYFTEPKDHNLLKLNTLVNVEFDSSRPFFYSDGNRTYFASPEKGDYAANSVLKKTVKSSAGIFDNEIRRPISIASLSSVNSNGWHTDDPIVTDPIIIISDPGFGGTGGFELNPFDASFENKLPCEYAIKYGAPVRKSNSSTDLSLQFHTFHHPFSSKFVTRLNQDGISTLMGSDCEDPTTTDNAIISDEGTTFEAEYDPDFEAGLVQPHIDNLSDRRTYYQENICFDTYGANSLYNWELFFHAPLYIATRLSKNGKYKEAMKWFHYSFDPTTNEKPDADSENETSRYWKVKPFKTTPIKTLQNLLNDLNRETDPDSDDFKEDSEYSHHVTEWRKNPFDPHLVASNRPIAYMEHVVVKYIENLIDWGDSLFRQFTRENVYEATQLYVIASQILGKRPEVVPKRGIVKTETYSSLKNKLDAFGNALVELENVFPMSSEVSSSTISTSTNLLGIGEALYFCIPANTKLMEYWDTVEDRLFKIRHCQNIEGVEQSLALFSPPIDPAALIQARSQGLSLSNILTDLNSPPPLYRFAYLLQKANEFCNDVKSLGSAVLSALEKRDGEELGRLRASQETNLLERVTEIRERQILAAKLGIESLLKTRETAEMRLSHYKELLGDDSDEPVGPPELDGNLTADGPLPVDTIITPIKTEVEMSLVGSSEGGVKIIPREDEQLSKSELVKRINSAIGGIETLAGIVSLIPKIDGYGAPLGTGIVAKSPKWDTSIHLAANAARGVSSHLSAEASQASIMSGYIRRTHDWAFQANLAISGIVEIDKQITSADIQLQIAEKELKNHLQKIENSKEVELFLKNKFTNQELYQWMKEQLFSVYKQSYNLAFEMAKKAEKAFQYELGSETSSFIQYGYWDSSREGLVSGEKLQLGLRQLENEYLNRNRRELELSKSISVALLNPLALIELRETGKCHLSLPEELFDLDYQGHYFRRIKSVSLSIPCVAGPYTSVNCSLRLLNNTYRKNTQMNADPSGMDAYEHDNDGGIPLDDNRFRSSNVPVSLMATSNGQNDAGLFEFSFRDERYLPFEGAGVISNWVIELTQPKDLRQFDYATIADVILHLKYTARESSGSFKDEVITHLRNHLEQNDNNAAPSLRMFNLKQDFPTQWHRFLHPTAPELKNTFELEMSANLFPILDKGKTLNVSHISVFAKPGAASAGVSYEVVIKPPAVIDPLELEVNNQIEGLDSWSLDTAIDIDLNAPQRHGS